MTRTPIITQADVARIAGVTRLTVQRALRGQPGVGKSTAQRIQQLAKTHGYMPNAAATATRTGRFNAVGLLVGSVSPRYLPAELVHGVEESLIDSGQQLLFSSLSDQKLADERFLPLILQNLMVDGLLIHYTHQFPDKLPDLIANNRVPSIWINTRLEQDCVYLDDHQAAYNATQLFIEHGHRRISYIERDAHGHYSETDRRSGYERAMGDAGLAADLHTLRYPGHANPQNDTRFADAHAWLSRTDRPSAVLTYSATIAGPLAGAAVSLGMQIPRDLSVICFDRIQQSPIGIPLTCVNTSMEQAARIAVRMLQDKIINPTQIIPVEKVLPAINEPVSVGRPAPQ